MIVKAICSCLKFYFSHGAEVNHCDRAESEVGMHCNFNTPTAIVNYFINMYCVCVHIERFNTLDSSLTYQTIHLQYKRLTVLSDFFSQCNHSGCNI